MKTAASNVDFAVSAPPSKRLAARRAAFLSAAREVFQQKGFAEATLDDVIALSGGSRQTLYALFGGKQGLFEALVTETCWSIFGKLPPERLASQSPDLVLTEVGVRYLEIVLSPPALNLTRLVVAEAARIPEIAETYWRLGPGRSRAFLTEFFRPSDRARRIRDGRHPKGRRSFPRDAVRDDPVPVPNRSAPAAGRRRNPRDRRRGRDTVS